MKSPIHFALALTLSAIPLAANAAEDAAPFLGRWALTIPGGGAGWLEITQQDGYLDGSILWGGGSVVPVDSVYLDGDALFVTRLNTVERKDAAGKVIRTQNFTEIVSASVSGDTLDLKHQKVNTNGLGAEREPFTGKRIPDLPPAPDLSKVKFGKPQTIFNGKDLAGWQLTEASAANGWSAVDGVLINDPVQEEGKPKKHYGNLRTDAEYEDFNLTLEVNVVPKGNSGVYLRGIYEVQVMDSFGMEIDPHHMGGIYSRIAPTAAVEKPAGEWQTMDITLVERHVTVKLNGALIIDNQPLQGCTGGALWSDESRPGPVYLQGDHAGVKYRNIVLRPVVE